MAIFADCNKLSPRMLVMFSAAFDKPVYGEGKYYQHLRAPFQRFLT
jgi:hypothetical protein